MNAHGFRATLAAALADEIRDCDVVVVGTGVAGLSTALALPAATVHVLTKTTLESGSSLWAQGGVATALGADDSPAAHAADTLSAGAGLGDPDVVALLTEVADEHMQRLIESGARFDRDAAGQLALGREGAHSHRRILHAGGDATGAEMVRALVAQLAHDRAAQAPQIFEGAFAHDLVVDDDGRVGGVLARHRDGRTVWHRAGAVVLASGGFGQLYARTTNPPEATGDGLAMAARAGAVLADLAFVQFHPTALAAGDDPLPLLTEALRGEGATLIDRAGARFMLAEHELAELAPRDVVARAIGRRLARGEDVYLDAREAVGDAFPERFPTVWAHCRRRGLDPRRQPLPVTPAAHYAMAGVATDDRGRASLPGLWACGEVAATGIHGANRLASNSLLEALVFGQRVAADIGASGWPRSGGAAPVTVRRERSGPAVTDDRSMRRQVRDRMWRHVGLERSQIGLAATLRWLERAGRHMPAASETANLVTVGRLVTAAALARDESRGAHFRTDAPTSLAAHAHRSFWTYHPDPNGLSLAPADPIVAPVEALRRIA